MGQTATGPRHRFGLRDPGRRFAARHGHLVLESQTGTRTNRIARRGPAAGTHDVRPVPCPRGDVERRPRAGPVVLTTRKSILEARKQARAREPARTDHANARGGRKGLRRRKALQAKQQANEQVQNRFRRFLDHRKEALFRDTQFPKDIPGLVLPTSLDLTRKAAEEALGVFATPGEQRRLDARRSSRSALERTTGRGQGRLLRAAIGPGRSGGRSGPGGQVDRALRILESADRLRPNHSRAYHLRKASFLARKNDRAGAGSGARPGPAHPPARPPSITS